MVKKENSMRDIVKELCYFMHKFVSEHIEELRRPPYEITDYKNEKQMLSAIKKNEEDAVWALTELSRPARLPKQLLRLFASFSIWMVNNEKVPIEIFWFKLCKFY